VENFTTKEDWAVVRAVAGLALKSFLESPGVPQQVSTPLLGYIRSALLAMLDPSHYSTQSEEIPSLLSTLRDVQARRVQSPEDAQLAQEEQAALGAFPYVLAGRWNPH
jgi:hypothetical protein